MACRSPIHLGDDMFATKKMSTIRKNDRGPIVHNSASWTHYSFCLSFKLVETKCQKSANQKVIVLTYNFGSWE